jgi:peptidoglycan/xylan/chitin deacetylase (PgdA/CDA1 family)
MIKLLKKMNRWRLDKLAQAGRLFDKNKKGPKAVVLMYHRVTTLTSDPLMLAVTPSTFDDQLKALKSYFNIISIDEMVGRLRSRSLKGNELAITFDDGYADNMKEALPIAARHNVPFTVFVTTGPLISPSFSFPWDASYGNDRSTYLSQSELKTFSENDLVTIGTHTVNHPRLRDLSTQAQHEEILASKKTLESSTGLPVNYFAYPYGGALDFTPQTKKGAQEAGITAAFATGDRIITSDCDMYAIPRINVRECPGDELVDKVKHYL